MYSQSVIITKYDRVIGSVSILYQPEGVYFAIMTIWLHIIMADHNK